MLELMKRSSLIERPPAYNNNNNNNQQSQQCVKLRKKSDNNNKQNLNLNNIIRPKSLLLCSTTDYDDTYYTSHNQSNTWKFHKPNKIIQRPCSLNNR